MTRPFVFIDPAELTSEQVVQIRAWRVDQDMTWRAVAEAAAGAWGADHGSNQLAGEELCRAAALALGEDPSSEP
ncbi:hypothetical protein GCM10023196_032610 [Actinoallomurus vinaceus]|uniref:DUF982 domain-containing protein n=1 Tax=Actinoallomurus vinaceus TaxID=1080074 RepID=A0ABP8U7Z8_9ACTN